MQHAEWTVNGEELVLLTQKAIWWPTEQALIISDFHLGKASHFRKAGIPVPFSVYYQNIEKFVQLLQWRKPQRVIFLGDLFHSAHNKEWQYFTSVLEQFAHIKFELVLGNHDILDESHFTKSGLKLHTELRIRSFYLTHEPCEEMVPKQVNLCGHIHPSVVMRGKARQGVQLPCFYFNGYNLIMPAFGEFTGSHKMKPSAKHEIFVIAGNKVLKVN
ncbi:MAG: ligase-associated DNA damage response endonuclease PdeM [Bacteroidetes bacterium]|nr:ligase-associated DNA damage response endonuclease PdeM [Bacteroidota bacterium]